MAEMSHSFRTEFMHGWDFIPGQDAFVHTGNEQFYGNYYLGKLGGKPDLDGYNWKQLWIVDLAPHEAVPEVPHEARWRRHGAVAKQNLEAAQPQS